MCGNWWCPAQRQAGMRRSNYRLNWNLTCLLSLNSRARCLQFLPVLGQYVSGVFKQFAFPVLLPHVDKRGQTNKARNSRGAHFVYKINRTVFAQAVVPTNLSSECQKALAQHLSCGYVVIINVLTLDNASWLAKLAVVGRGHSWPRLGLPERQGASNVLTRIPVTG